MLSSLFFGLACAAIGILAALWMREMARRDEAEEQAERLETALDAQEGRIAALRERITLLESRAAAVSRVSAAPDRGADGDAVMRSPDAPRAL